MLDVALVYSMNEWMKVCESLLGGGAPSKYQFLLDAVSEHLSHMQPVSISALRYPARDVGTASHSFSALCGCF